MFIVAAFLTLVVVFFILLKAFTLDVGAWYTHYTPTPTQEVSPTPEVTPESTPSATPVPEIPNAGHGDGLSDGKSDGRSDGLCSQPPCVINQSGIPLQPPSQALK